MRDFHSPSQTIGAIIRGFERSTTKNINNPIRNIKNISNKTGELQFAPMPDLDPDFDLEEINLSGKGSIWQGDYFDIIINSEETYNNISNHIINNPKNWERDKSK